MKGDSIYIFSDGYADQFGSNANSKLKRKRLKEYLLSIQHLPMNQQGVALKKFIANYRQNTEQTDDILVMGVYI